MLSHYKREVENFKEILIKQRGLTEKQADEEIEKRRPEVILSLINEALLVQKGKDIPGMSEEVEADVNREVIRVAKQYNLRTIEELEEAMRRDGQKLSDVRDTLRKHYMRQAVLQNEVDRKIYFAITEADAKKYHAENRTKFQSVTISEIYLSLAGRDEAQVLAKAKQLVAEGRAGKDFAELAVKNSERQNVEKTKGLLADETGKARNLLLAELNGPILEAIKDLKAGGVSEPIKLDEGFLILRVNTRDDAFNDRQVRAVMTQERSEKERDQFLSTLRREAYIKPARNYEALIKPALEKDVQSTATKADDSAAAKNAKDKKKSN
jgi:parvulin-like peptidyl-prolyl isomerase